MDLPGVMPVMADTDQQSETIQAPCQPDEGDRESTLDTPEYTQVMHGSSGLRLLIDDDVFRQLKKNFLMIGKGRRPDLPVGLTVMHRLLLQLYLVKEEGNKSFKCLKSWLGRLVPDTATVTEGRITKKVQSIVETCRMPDLQITDFLEQHFIEEQSSG